ncbi:hypothetical protein HEB94_009431 [Actinopolymorpha pittospori]|uniref:Uncharacterized protein n=1 Tax=Actinopolymorpha pittospori TaxID=648752 RepID=A0A927N999_9ACTN|nr:hypothetical protein [Actinopolymorpha pittospori]
MVDTSEADANHARSMRFPERFVVLRVTLFSLPRSNTDVQGLRGTDRYLNGMSAQAVEAAPLPRDSWFSAMHVALSRSRRLSRWSSLDRETRTRVSLLWRASRWC